MILPNLVTLSVLVHHAYAPETYGATDSIRDAYHWLIKNGLLVKSTQVTPKFEQWFDLTERGNVMVRKLISTPLPEKKVVETWEFPE